MRLIHVGCPRYLADGHSLPSRITYCTIPSHETDLGQSVLKTDTLSRASISNVGFKVPPSLLGNF